MKINLGCGDGSLAGFINVDIQRGPGIDIVADLNVAPWNFPPGAAEHIRAYHVFEHLRDKATTLNECYRILAPHGLLEFEVPTTDGWGAWSDPQHVSFWNPDDLNYLSAQRNPLVYSYGKKSDLRCNFDVEHLHIFEMRPRVICMNVRLRKAPIV